MIQLKEKTIQLIKNPKLLEKMSKAAIKKTDKFSEEKSKQRFYSVVIRTDKVSIIIGTHNNISYLKRCLESIFKYTPPGYELIVINNGDFPVIHKYLQSLEYPVIEIRNKDNKSFAKFNNQGVKASNRELVCFLNDDTEVNYNWLSTMIDMFDDLKVGAVQPRLLFPDGTIQCDGIAFKSEDKLPYHLNQRKPVTSPDTPVEVEVLTGACMMVRKKLAHFDEIYERGYFEDSDLCLTLLEKGYKLILQRQSNITHYEGISMAKINEKLRIHKKNKELFLNKWGNKLPRLIHFVSETDFNEGATIIPLLPQIRFLEIMLSSKIEKIGDEWEHYSNEIAPHIEYTGEVFNLKKLEDKQFDKIYCSNILNHLSYIERDRALLEWYRVLKRGGTIEIRVPDIQSIFQYYLQYYDEKAIEWMYGKQEDSINFYKSGYSERILIRLLREAGFNNPRRIFIQTQNINNKDKNPEILAVIAEK